MGLLLAGCTALTDVDVDVGTIDLETETAVNREFEFLSAEESQQILQAYGDKLGAVDRIDLRLEALEPNVRLQVGSAILTRVGQRAPLGGAYQKQVIAAVKAGQAVTLPFITDGAMHSRVQAILVVQALEAL